MPVGGFVLCRSQTNIGIHKIWKLLVTCSIKRDVIYYYSQLYFLVQPNVRDGINCVLERAL